MAHTKSAIKRLRTSKQANLRNRMRLSELKTLEKKLRAAVDALTAGVFRAHIINGTTPHSLLLELLTDAGVGTVIHSTETAYEFDTHPHPLSTFAARLFENLDEVSKLQALS